MKFANRVFIIRWGFVFVYGHGWCFLKKTHQILVEISTILLILKNALPN